MRPVARRDGLLIRELPDELLVYDRDHHRAHCLNRTAAAVFRQADGTQNVADLARIVHPGVEPSAGAAAVRMALDELDRAGLLREGVSPGGLSRREAVRRAAVAAAVLLPAVASVVAPTPAEAAATCVTSCAGQPDATPCACFGEDPCTATCIAESCSVGGC